VNKLASVITVGKKPTRKKNPKPKKSAGRGSSYVVKARTASAGNIYYWNGQRWVDNLSDAKVYSNVKATYLAAKLQKEYAGIFVTAWYISPKVDLADTFVEQINSEFANSPPRKNNPVPHSAYIITALWTGSSRGNSAHAGKLVFWDGYGWTLLRKNAVKVKKDIAETMAKNAVAQNSGKKMVIAIARNDERDSALLEQMTSTLKAGLL